MWPIYIQPLRNVNSALVHISYVIQIRTEKKYFTLMVTIKPLRTSLYLFANVSYFSLTGTSAVSSSVGGVLDGDKNRMQRVSSVDSFNQVHILHASSVLIFCIAYVQVSQKLGITHHFGILSV